jgi:hypothetical protein
MPILAFQYRELGYRGLPFEVYAGALTELVAPTAKTITSTAFRETLTLGEDLRLLRVELALGQNP